MFESDVECIAALRAIGVDPTAAGGPNQTFEAVDAYKMAAFPELCKVQNSIPVSSDGLAAFEAPRNPEEAANKERIEAQLSRQKTPKPGKELQTMEKIIEGKRKQLVSLQQAEPDLLAAAALDERWAKWVEADRAVRPHREQWAAADAEVGAISNENGAALEGRLDEIMASEIYSITICRHTLLFFPFFSFFFSSFWTRELC